MSLEVDVKWIAAASLVLGACTVADPSYAGEDAETAVSTADDVQDESGSQASSSTDASSGDTDTTSGDGDGDTGDGDGDAGDGDGDTGDGDGDGDGDGEFQYTSRDCTDADLTTTMADVQAVFNLHCIECHSGNNAPHGQDLSPGNAWTSIVNVSAGNCAKIRVIPEQPAASYILDKLEDIDLCGGTQMPKNEDPLSLADRNTIQNWICAGAPE